MVALCRLKISILFPLQMFSECHNQLKAIRRSTLSLTGCESIITQNLIAFLSGRLQDVTSDFRKSQNEYLASKIDISWIFFLNNHDCDLEIKAREAKSAHFFEFEEEVDPLTEALDRRLHQQAQMLADDNSRFVEQREKEIQNIVKSISDLNTIFKELATMVTEQVSTQ